MYAYDARLGWFPVPRSTRRYDDGARTIVATHNERGFRDRDHGAKDRPRLLFLGDSFVWGYGVGDGDRFTDFLQKDLPDWEVFNEGVSGYGTDQELLVLEATLEDVAPDLVVLVFCSNDDDDNSTNERYVGYFKPYFVEENGTLRLRGVPVPKSINYYAVAHPKLFRVRLVRALADLLFRSWGPAKVQNPDPTLALLARMRTLVESRRARFLVGCIDPCPAVEAFLAKEGVPTVRLETELRFMEPGPGGKLFPGHWTPEGHAVIAREMREFLETRGMLGETR
jgi:GDSL-like Lipase/Acylhydrolase family